jgi:serine/threonine-protein kinase RsbW
MSASFEQEAAPPVRSVDASGCHDAGAAPSPLMDHEVFELAVAVGQVSAARGAVVEKARSCGIAAEAVEDLAVVVSELVANAIRHGGGSGRLRCVFTADEVIVQVYDHGDGFDASDVGDQPAPPTLPGRRGLWLCRQLSRRLDIISDPTGTAVTATVAVAQP